MILTGGRRSSTAESDRGAVAIIVAVFVIGFLIVLAFVVDQGRVFAQRSQLQNAVDAAALAAVQETCLSPTRDPAVVRQVAITYAADNGVTLDPANVIVQDGPADFTTGVSAAAEQTVSQFFGGFAGISEATVAARGTATRVCRRTFQYVADEDFNFNGTGADLAGAIYAGQCFSGNAGKYSFVAVSKPDTFACPNPADYPIFNNNSQSNLTNCPNRVGGCEYDLTGVTAALAVAEAGYNITAIDALPLTRSNCNAVVASDYNADIICAGNLDVPNGVTIRHSVIVRGGDYDDKASTEYDDTAGPFLIYTDTGRIKLNSNRDIGPGVTFYAPTPTGQSNQYAFTYIGGSQDMDGTVIGYDLRMNGGGSLGSSGVDIRIAGPWRPSQ